MEEALELVGIGLLIDALVAGPRSDACSINATCL